eukprot:tig00020563_g11354.t1
MSSLMRALKRARTSLEGALNGFAASAESYDELDAVDLRRSEELRGAPRSLKGSESTEGALVARAPAAEALLDSLPDGVLSRILFFLCSDDAPEETRPASMAQCVLELVLGEQEQPPPPDLRPEPLLRLRGVCRRWRKLSEHESLWGGIHIASPSDAACEGVCALPRRLRRAARSLRLTRYTASDAPEALSTLARDEHLSRVRRLRVSCAEGSEGSDLSRLFEVLPVFAHFSELELLEIATPKELVWPGDVGLCVQSSLSLLGGLPRLVSLQIASVPVTLPTLKALAPLAPTLRDLSVTALVSGDDPAGPVISACAALAGLTSLRLDITCTSPAPTAPFAPRAVASDLVPLSSLLSLRALAVPYCTESLAFLVPLSNLEALYLQASPGAICTPLASLPRLRSLGLSLLDASPEAAAAAAAVIPRLSGLELLGLTLDPATMEHVAAQRPAWPRLHTAELNCVRCERAAGAPPLLLSGVLPSGILQRVSGDAPLLRVLRTRCPLPLFDRMEALLPLKRLHRLVLAGAAARAADHPSLRRLLRNLLPGVQLVLYP